MPEPELDPAGGGMRANPFLERLDRTRPDAPGQ
jgi:hypothetical protein